MKPTTSIYATIIGTIAGICLGYALLFLFVGLRRAQDKRIYLFFALFALGYAGTVSRFPGKRTSLPWTEKRMFGAGAGAEDGDRRRQFSGA